MSEMLSSLEHLVRKQPSGTVLFREGDRGQTMYVIRSGKVNISKRIGDSEITLAVLGPGEFFGEMALLEGLPRSAGATVVVRNLGAPPDAKGRRMLPDDLTPQALTRRVGLGGEEARRVERVLERSGLLVRLESGRWALGPEQLVKDFLLYIEMQEQYDPLDLHQLAELAGLNERDAAQIARRVLEARLAERRGAQETGDAYGTYLALKQRFEYAEVDAS